MSSPGGTQPSLVVAATWDAQRRWSITANRLKQSLWWGRITVLALTLGGAVLVALGTSVRSLD